MFSRSSAVSRFALKIMGKGRGFYAVARGHNVGVYDTWDDCKQQVNGVQNARYKKFNTMHEAQDFVNQNSGATQASGSRYSTRGNSRSAAASHGYSAPEAPAYVPVPCPPPPSASSSLFALRNNRKRGLDTISSSASGSSAPKSSRSFSTTTTTARSGISSSNWEDAQVVYTDGACSSNGRSHARAGYGVFWGDGHPDNVSEPLVGPPTNNRAELQAVVKALEQGRDKGLDKMVIRTDSNLLIQSMDKWIIGWKKNGWVTASKQPVKNRDLLEKIDKLKTQMPVKFEHVRGHAGIHGNEMADQLAVAGAGRYGRSSAYLPGYILAPMKRFLNAMTSHSWDQAHIVYTDGACLSNGRSDARAGYGVFWGDGHPDNVSEALLGPATNNRAELQAVVKALEQGRDMKLDKMIIRTDSNLLIQSMDKWIIGWKKNGWLTSSKQPVKNRDLLEKIDKLKTQMPVKFEHVRGHAGIH